jgi:hypothetical protein
VKCVPELSTFLVDEVNLNQTRIDTLASRVGTIETFLTNSTWQPKIRGFSPQGSWAHRTIIKPAGDSPFDADLIVFVDPVPGWRPTDYIVELRAVFRASDRYRELASMSTRCVTLTYAGDFCLDVVPCVVDRHSPGTLEVCNRKDDAFEPTNPLRFTAWLDERNLWVGSNQLQHVIRLIKYLRDIKGTFSAKSILLTTLVGSQINPLDAREENQKAWFSDLPTALRILVGRLDNLLQANPAMPTVRNPVLPTEHFNRHWDQENYDNFRDKIRQYREWIDDAYADADRDESVAKWRRVFGEEFAKGVVAERATKVASVVLAESHLPGADIVDAVSRFGRAILQRLPRNLPHVSRPTWRTVKPGSDVVVQIRAGEYLQRDGDRVDVLESGRVVPKTRELLFEAVTATGMPFPTSDYDVRWRVVNTDQEAARAGGLRGGFYKSRRPGARWGRARPTMEPIGSRRSSFANATTSVSARVIDSS